MGDVEKVPDAATPRRPEFFEDMERIALGEGEAEATLLAWNLRSKSFVASGAGYLLLILIAALGPTLGLLFWNEAELPDEAIRVRFYIPGGEGHGGGGGGGGSGGERPTAYIPERAQPENPEEQQPRRAPIAPRKPRALNADSLVVPDLPSQTAALMDGFYSPDATELPGLFLNDGTDYGGLDTVPSSGSGGGIGGGDGTGVGTGQDWGVGPGRGGGFGGGDFRPGAYDIEPELVYQPPTPPYPARARERMVSGEVILQILVQLDGSTKVVGVIKSLPYCVEEAKANAKLWRWKPALKDGKPVVTSGIITITFDLLGRMDRKS